MAKKKENEFNKLAKLIGTQSERTEEKLARLIKEEGDDIRTELGGKIESTIKSLERRMDERFTGIERRLDETIQPQLDGHARRIKVLEIKTARTR